MEAQAKQLRDVYAQLEQSQKARDELKVRGQIFFFFGGDFSPICSLRLLIKRHFILTFEHLSNCSFELFVILSAVCCYVSSPNFCTQGPATLLTQSRCGSQAVKFHARTSATSLVNRTMLCRRAFRRRSSS